MDFDAYNGWLVVGLGLLALRILMSD